MSPSSALVMSVENSSMRESGWPENSPYGYISNLRSLGGYMDVYIYLVFNMNETRGQFIKRSFSS